jgi:hypothetical protein
MQISTDTHQSRSSFGEFIPPPARYKGRENYSIYLPMRDGVRIAIDVILPKGLARGETIPALLIQSRYWRSMELRMPFKWFLKPEVLNPRYKDFQPFFTSRGYALVMVDVRGTGASYGVWRYPWTEDSIYDAGEIVDWIISQPWSNGRVAWMGNILFGDDCGTAWCDWTPCGQGDYPHVQPSRSLHGYRIPWRFIQRALYPRLGSLRPRIG